MAQMIVWILSFSAAANAQWGNSATANLELCEDQGTVILVSASKSLLLLCENSTTSASFKAALGRGGVGKISENDLKTPLGRYHLGSPRASAEFGTFVPVGYPTAEQKRRGYTGSAIGIHGPPRAFQSEWMGYFTQFANWTAGCIAVSSDAMMNEIAEWVKNHPKANIEILE